MELLKSKEFQPKNYTQKEIMDESLRNYKNAFRIFFTSGTVSCLMFTLLPILTNQNNLPFDAWYPYNWKESPWYEITYGHQIVSTFFLTFTNIGIDCFSAGMMAVVGCQCEILGHTLLNLYEFSRLELDDEREDRNDIFGRYNEQFENLIGHHKNILMLAKKLNGIFSFYVFGQMSLCILLFCTALFRLSVVEPGSVEFFNIIVFILTESTQLFLYCWFGNEVEVKSIKLHNIAFQCDWVGSPIDFQKNLRFFMQKTSKPIKIYALYFFPLSVGTFSSIMSSSWSYFAVLRQVHNKK